MTYSSCYGHCSGCGSNSNYSSLENKVISQASDYTQTSNYANYTH